MSAYPNTGVRVLTRGTTHTALDGMFYSHRKETEQVTPHGEVEIKDFQYDNEDSEMYFYPCPCGNNFSITKADLENEEDMITCPSCSLIIKVIYDKDQVMCGETIPAHSTNKELVKC
ncbi:DPH3 homolog [Choloepus didactylus]|uniref:DPH3 homolog n=1 Tax=Choloepus didactylus TaxID=27675 RepID=UPI00189E5FA8|nr:DPH3 homolog [Choloepus didactylus]